MNDPFLLRQICIDRLFNEWRRYGSLIVAYDYDNTVFDYHSRGDKFDGVVELLKACRSMGFHLTVFTSCNDDRFPEIKRHLASNNIPFDAINETPDFIPYKGRKVYYNILLDDRAGLKEAYEQLWAVIYTIRGFKASTNLDEIG